MEVWMKELGLTMNLHELGATEEMLHGIANGTIIKEGGYKVLNHDEVLDTLKIAYKPLKQKFYKSRQAL